MGPLITVKCERCGQEEIVAATAQDGRILSIDEYVAKVHATGHLVACDICAGELGYQHVVV